MNKFSNTRLDQHSILTHRYKNTELYYVIYYIFIVIKIWKSQEKKDDYQWTQLRGADKLKLLKKLPPLIDRVIVGDIVMKVQKLWEV